MEEKMIERQSTCTLHMSSRIYTFAQECNRNRMKLKRINLSRIDLNRFESIGIAAEN